MAENVQLIWRNYVTVSLCVLYGDGILEHFGYWNWLSFLAGRAPRRSSCHIFRMSRMTPRLLTTDLAASQSITCYILLPLACFVDYCISSNRNPRRIQDHRFWYQSKTSYDFLLVIRKSYMRFWLVPKLVPKYDFLLVIGWRGGATGKAFGLAICLSSVTIVLRPLKFWAIFLRSAYRGFKSCSRQRCVTTLGKLFTPMCLCHQAI